MVASSAETTEARTLLREDCGGDVRSTDPCAFPVELGSPWRRVASGVVAVTLFVGVAVWTVVNLVSGETSRQAANAHLSPVVKLASGETTGEATNARTLEQPAVAPLAATAQQNGSTILDVVATRICMKSHDVDDSLEGAESPICSDWGENCGVTGCCKEAGHQCYFKNFSFAACLADCAPGELNWFDDEEQKWLCEPLGKRVPGEAKMRMVQHPPKWATPGHSACAQWGEPCGTKGCCREEGHQCYVKNGTYATCLYDCVPGEPSGFDDDGGEWKCEVIGERTPGEAQPRMVDRPPKWAKPGHAACAAWGDNCGTKGCCREDGHQCFVKNGTYATCLPECTSPSWFEDEAFEWDCTPLGQRTPGKAKPRAPDVAPGWVGDICAKPGQDCRAHKCCAKPGQRCYESEEGHGKCMWYCQVGVHLNDEHMRNWTCKVLGPRTPGAIHEDKEENKSLPAWVETDCSKQEDDCSKTGCCAAPGTQCLRKNDSYAGCLASCPPDIDFSNPLDTVLGDWACEPVGPHTPGDAAPPPRVDESLRFDDLPSWVSSECSSTEDDCSSTRCCKDPEMQCYEREKGKSFCRKLCLPGMVLDDGKKWSCKELGPRTPLQCPACAPQEVGAPDVVIPFFERDLCKLKFTAKALSTNDPDHHLGNVFLMWVSKRRVEEFQGEIDEILAAIRQTREATLMDFTDRMQQTQPKPLVGWFAQQVVKLKAASVVQSEFYVVLDSKNTLIRKLERNPFLTPCNQAYIQAEFIGQDMVMPHIEWYEYSAAALGVPSPKDGSWPDALLWPASITPVVMHRQTVLDMLQTLGEGSSLDSLCQGQLCNLLGPWTDSGHGATEFTLYTLYVYNLMSSDNFKCVHSIDRIQGFKIEHGEDWLIRLKGEIVQNELRVHPEQMVIGNKDGWAIENSFEQIDEIPEDQWPLSFSDLTRKWSASLWRGEPQDAAKLAAENLRVLKNVIDGDLMSPLMFGAQPASLESMDEDKHAHAIDLVLKLYDQAHLLDDSESDFIGCVVGYHN